MAALALVLLTPCSDLRAQFGLVPVGTITLSGGVTVDSFDSADTNYPTGGIYDPVLIHPFGGITDNLQTPAGSFVPAAIIVKNSVSFSASGIVVDSFNSADTNFSTGGLYDSSKAKDNGDILCNGTGLCISVGGNEVYGHVNTGPGGTATVSGNGGIGSHAWLATNKGIEPNGTEGQVWYSHTASVTMPSVSSPYSAGQTVSGPVDIVTGTTGNFVTNHYDYSLSGSGQYYYSGTITGRVVVLGAAQLYLPNALTTSASFTILTNARLDLYVGASSCALGAVTNQTASSGAFTLWCLPGVSTLSCALSSPLIGNIYAPDTAVNVSGPSGISGSVAASSVTASGHAQFHFDENMTTPPQFPSQPQSQTVVAGQPATFYALAVGAPTIAYQWQFKGVPIIGATDSTLTINSASASDIGVYSLLATNAFGSAVSSNAVLTINFPPSIARQPVSQAAVLNSNLAFSVSANGTGPLAYQWRFNGQNISGATNSTFAIGAMQSSNVGPYTVVVTNNFSAMTSDVATLTVASPPEFLWARIATNANNTGTSEGTAMAIDALGNVFVAGDYQGYGVDFGGVTFTNGKAGAGNFICKYDSNGNLLWARQYGTNWYLRPKVAADGAGNVYVAGDYQGTVMFDTNVLNSAGQQETYLAKFDSQGQALWARRIGAYDLFGGWPGRALAIDSQNGVILLGGCTNNADFGFTNITGFPGYLANYDANGNLLWARGVATPGTAITLGASGSIYACSQTNLTRYDSVGNVVWSRPFGRGQALTLDADENIYVTGWGTGVFGDLTITNVNGSPDFFIARCDSSGNVTWSRQLGSTNQENGIAISLDCFRNVYIGASSASAWRQASLKFGNSTLTNFVGMLMKYDAAGNPLWAKTLGGTNRATSWGMAVLNPGAIYLAGSFYYAGQFGNFPFTTPNNALYVAKLAGMEAPDLPQITGQPLSQKVRAGTTTSFNVTAPSGIPLTYQWYLNGSNAVGGCTDASLVFTNVQMNAAGLYNVAVANAYGSVTSSVANLTVYLTEAATLSAPIGPSSGSPMQLQVSGVAGFRYAVEASTNLTDWAPLMTNTAPFLFPDANSAAYPHRFYRVRWVGAP